MSANAASLPCPICLHTGVFHTVQSLKDRLIFVSTNNLLCPVCQEEVSGLDKLTIHLFSHVRIAPTQQPTQRDESSEIQSTSQQPTKSASEPQKKTKVSGSKNKTLSSPNTQMKFVKIYPKLPVITLNTMPIIDITPNAEGSVQSSNSSLYISTTVKTETSLLPTTNKCDICGLQFVDANILRMHKCLIHNIEDNSQHTFTRYNCHLCSKSFKMRGSLMVHLRVAHFGFASSQNSEPKTDTENQDRNGNNVSDDQPTDLERRDGKQWQCDVCRKCFTTKYFLKKHKRLHTGETPYACTQCNKTFTFQQSYHKHLLYHNDEKPHTCSFCGRAFKELSTLHNHQRIHTGEKPFACETCGKCFRQRVSYLVHRRIHTGAMPYKCTACDKSFRYKVSQRTHKCQVQPPGTVIRKTGDFVEKLKKKKESVDTTLNSDEIDTQSVKYENTKYPEISEVNAELVRTGAQLSLEDMESENFTILSEAFGESSITCSNNYTAALPSNAPPDEKTIDISSIDELIDSIPAIENSIPSPSDILKKLCLSSEEEFFNANQCNNNDETYDMNRDLNDYL